MTRDATGQGEPGAKGYERYVKDVSTALGELGRRREEEISHFMLERADMLVLGIRPDGVISIFNKKCQELTGLTKAEVVGKMSVVELLPRNVGGSLEDIMERFREGSYPRSFVSPLECRCEKVCQIRWSHSTIRDEDGVVTDYLAMGDDITERRHLEEELEWTKTRYSKLVRSLPVGVLLTDGQGNVQLSNDQIQRWLEAVKRPQKRSFNVLSNPNFVESGISHLFRRAINHRAAVGEKGVKLEGTGGGAIFFNIHVAPIIDGDEITGTTAIFEDITERRHMEYGFRRSQAFMASVLEQSGLAMTVVDNTGNIQLFNQGAEELTGYSEEEVRGKPIALFYRNKAHMLDINRRFKRDGVITNVEAMITRRDGTEVPIALSMSMLRDAEGELIGSLGISVDLSQQKELEQELDQASKLAVLGRFAAGVAHELNTPLANISLISENLEMNAKNPVFVKKLGTIRSQVDRASRIVWDLLQYSRKIEPELAVFDLGLLLEECLADTPEPKLEGIEVVASYPSGLEINADRAQMSQVFDNLIRNACDAMGDGGKLAISARIEGSQALVTVEDNGTGIEPEDINNIFEPFFTKKKEKGTGLGLSISQGIVDAHGGAILVQSQPDQGATFTVKLPTRMELAG